MSGPDVQHLYDYVATQITNTLVPFFESYLMAATTCAEPVHKLLTAGKFTNRKAYPTEAQFIEGTLNHCLTTCHMAARSLAEGVRASTQRSEVSQQTINALRAAFLDDSFSELRATVLRYGDELRDLDARLASETSVSSGLRDMAGGAVMGKAVHFSLGGRSSSSMPAFLGAMTENLAGLGRAASLKKAQQSSWEDCLSSMLAKLEQLPSLVVDQFLTLTLPTVDRQSAQLVTDAVQKQVSQCVEPARAITQTLVCFYALDIDRVRSGRAIYGRLYDALDVPVKFIPGVGGIIRDYNNLERAGKEMEQRYPIHSAIGDLELALRGQVRDVRAVTRTHGDQAPMPKLPERQPKPPSPGTDSAVTMLPAGADRSPRVTSAALATPRAPFWASRWFAVAMLILIWPLGLYLLWKNASFSRRTKWFVTAGYAVFVVWYIAAGAGRV